MKARKKRILKFISNIKHELRLLVNPEYFNKSVLQKRKVEIRNEIMNYDIDIRIQIIQDVTDSVISKTKEELIEKIKDTTLQMKNKKEELLVLRKNVTSIKIFEKCFQKV